MPKGDPSKLRKVTVNLPFGIGGAEWEADSTERRAAWALYVELITRISTQPLAFEQGLTREALNSLYSLFGSTREILREAGPDVGASRSSVGGIAITVLNNGLRPFLSKWHPLLATWEARRPDNIGAKEYEEQWCYATQVRGELESLRQDLGQYANALAKIAGIDL